MLKRTTTFIWAGLLALAGLSSCNLFEKPEDYMAKDMATIENFLSTDPSYAGTPWRKTPGNVYLVTTKAPIGGSYGEIDFEDWGKDKIIHAYVNAKRFDNVTFMKDSSYVCHFLQDQKNAGTFLYGMTLGMMDMKGGEEVEMFIPSPFAMGGSSGTIGGTYIAPNTIMRVNVRDIVAYDSIEQRHYEIKQLEDYAKAKYPGMNVEKIGNYGLMKVVLQPAPSDAEQVTDLKQTTISYKGTLLSGSKFDENENFVFYLSSGQFIKGWAEGLKTMKKGEKSILLIPSNLGYYADPPRGSIIKQFSPLAFEIEVKNIK